MGNQGRLSREKRCDWIYKLLGQLWRLCCEKTIGQRWNQGSRWGSYCRIPTGDDSGLDQDGGCVEGEVIWFQACLEGSVSWGLLMGWIRAREKKRNPRWLQGFRAEQWAGQSCHQLGWGPWVWHSFGLGRAGAQCGHMMFEMPIPHLKETLSRRLDTRVGSSGEG